MKAEKIGFKNYRNLVDDEIELSEGVNIFTGQNAQGKTNILEGIWLFSSCKSFRGSDDKDFINTEKDFCELNAAFTKNERTNEARIKISRGKRKELYRNDAKVRPAELVGSFNTVLFFPEQLFLVKGAPEQRRKFLDFAIFQLKPRYLEYSAEYAKLLAQKNHILKNGRPDMLSTIEQWNAGLAKTGAYISFMRKSYLDRIFPYAQKVSGEISGGKEELSLSFIPSGFREGEFCDNLSDIEEIIFNKMNSLTYEEIAAKHSLVGCHRDDFVIGLNGMPAKTFASQGQQRSCVIALKSAEAEFIKDTVGEYPVMLFDDVFSELDSMRKKYILNHIKDKQVIVTCCEPIDGLSNGEAAVFTVDGGRVKKECI